MESIEFKPGTRLAGRYLLQRHLGHGGMGTVWLAKDEALDDLEVATKLLLPELVTDSQFISSLKEEAKSSMLLSHPNIVKVYNLHRDENDAKVAFLVLKYIRGGTMKEVLQEWPSGVPIERVLRWAKQLASALDYAHENGVVHRDIKPSNIMIDEESDSAMLMDFGISRQCDQTIRSGTSAGQTGLGTLAYMSPQQLHDKDCKSNDIYSLAATLYQTLSGRPPFIGSDIEEQILRNDPEPISGVSDSVNRALLAGLAKDELDRPESAEDLVDLMVMIDPHRTGAVVIGGQTKTGVINLGQPINPSKSGFPLIKLFVALAVISGAVVLALNYEEWFASTPNTASPVVDNGAAGPQDGGGIDDISGSDTIADDGGGSDMIGDLAGDRPGNLPGMNGDGSGGDASNAVEEQPVATNQNGDQDEERPLDLNDRTPDLFTMIRRGNAEDVGKELTGLKARGQLESVLSEIDPNTGYRLIHAAVASGRVDMVAAVLENGASIQSVGSMPAKATPLHVAAEFGHVEVIKLLIDSGANLHTLDGGRRTPLHIAAKRCRTFRDLQALQLLVNAGSDIDARDPQGKRAIDLVPMTSQVLAGAKEALS